MLRDKTKLAALAALGTCVIYGFSFMASRIALGHTSAEMMLAIRFTVSMLVMAFLVVTGIFHIDLRGKPVGSFLLMGLCQPVIYFIGETSGIQYTNSSFAGIIIATIPVFTVILSAIFLHEKITLRTFAWIMCSVAGAFIISISQTSSGAVQFKGIMLLMGFAYFTAQAAVRHGSEFVPLFIDGITDRYVLIPILYLSMLSSVVAFLLQNYSVTYLSLAKATVFENIIPVISVAAGVIFLGEPFSLIQLAGIVLILLGVWKVTTEKSLDSQAS